MKIAYVSDIHLEFHDSNFPDKVRSVFVLSGPDMIKAHALPDTIDADVLVIAGDLHHDAAVRAVFIDKLEKAYGIPVLYVAGNHCCHHQALGGSLYVPELRKIGGITIGLATLWTELAVMDMVRAFNFIDMKEIVGMDGVAWNDLHTHHLKTLLDWQPDVIVTHHAPFKQSLSKGYAGHPDNCFFINERISPDWFPNTQLWVHGHVHQDHDYKLGDLRVVCNPKGYPFEVRPTKIKIVTI